MVSYNNNGKTKSDAYQTCFTGKTAPHSIYWQTQKLSRDTEQHLRLLHSTSCSTQLLLHNTCSRRWFSYTIRIRVSCTIDPFLDTCHLDKVYRWNSWYWGNTRSWVWANASSILSMVILWAFHPTTLVEKYRDAKTSFHKNVEYSLLYCLMNHRFVFRGGRPSFKYTLHFGDNIHRIIPGKGLRKMFRSWCRKV